MTVVTSRRTAWAVTAIIAAALAATLLNLPGGRTASVRAATDVATDTVSVTGLGTADGAPDSLGVDFTVSVTRSTVQSALDAQSAAARRLFAALQRAGVARRDLRTTDLNLDRHYDSHGAVTGYDAGQTIHATVSPLRRAGATISAAATSSGNDIEVGSLSFDLVHDDAVVRSARTNAFGDARDRAEQYAALSGRALGRVQKITEQIDYPEPVPFYGFADKLSAARSSAVPLRAGRQTLTVWVTVVWSLR